MADTRKKNTPWQVPAGECTYEQAQLAVLMDIRDELQTLNKACKRVPHLFDVLARVDRRLQANGFQVGAKGKARVVRLVAG